MAKTWGAKVIPKDQWIDPTKQYTCDGFPVTSISIGLHNSAGDEVTYPVKGTIVYGKRKRVFGIWSLNGLNNVVWPKTNMSLIEMKAGGD